MACTSSHCNIRREARDVGGCWRVGEAVKIRFQHAGRNLHSSRLQVSTPRLLIPEEVYNLKQTVNQKTAHTFILSVPDFFKSVK